MAEERISRLSANGLRRGAKRRSGACGVTRKAFDTNALQLFWLLAQMVRIGKQFSDRLGLGRIVIAADLTMSIHQHHPRAVHRNSLGIAAVGDRKFEAVMGKFVNRRFRPGEKIPAARLSLQSLSVAT